MPRVIPFRGLLYADTSPSTMARVLAPPFDMIDESEQAALFERDPHNIAHLTLPRKDLDPEYELAGAALATWRADDTIAADDEPAIYVYEQARETGSAAQRMLGCIAGVRLDNIPSAGIHGHENTFPEPIADRVKLMRKTRSALEPVLGTYIDETLRIGPFLEAAIDDEPAFEATLAGSTHRLWRMVDPDQQSVVQEILAMRPVVIADGHHRHAGARAYRDALQAEGELPADHPANYVMMLLAEARTSGLQCGPFHRLVHRLPESAATADMASTLGPNVTVTPFSTEGLAPDEAARKLVADIARLGQDVPTFGCRWSGGAAIVQVTNLPGLLAEGDSEIPESIQAFDVALLHRLILAPRLGCTGEFGPRACGVTFEEDPVEAWRSVDEGVELVWFVNEATTEAVIAAALDGETVPQKATHFFPKPASGMVMYDLDC